MQNIFRVWTFQCKCLKKKIAAPNIMSRWRETVKKDLQMLFKPNLILFAVLSVNFKVTEFYLLWTLTEIYHCVEGQRQGLVISEFYSYVSRQMHLELRQCLVLGFCCKWGMTRPCSQTALFHNVLSQYCISSSNCSKNQPLSKTQL